MKEKLFFFFPKNVRIINGKHFIVARRHCVAKLYANSLLLCIRIYSYTNEVGA